MKTESFGLYYYKISKKDPTIIICFRHGLGKYPNIICKIHKEYGLIYFTSRYNIYYFKSNGCISTNNFTAHKIMR